MNVRNRKKFQWLYMIIVVMNFRKNVSIAKVFPPSFPGIFANIFKCKIIPVYQCCHQWAGPLCVCPTTPLVLQLDLAFPLS